MAMTSLDPTKLKGWQLAEAAEMSSKPLDQLGSELGLRAEELIPAGRGLAKVDHRAVMERLEGSTRGRYIDVTAITPTPLGEGKTTTTIGLVQGLARIGCRVAGAIRQPSGGPTFNLKGSGAGGGLSQCIPLAPLSIRLTGDLDSITNAHNLAMVALTARMQHERNYDDPKLDSLGLSRLDLDPDRVEMKWAIDFCAQSLRRINIGNGGKMDGYPMESGFQITASSELMAILAVSRDLADLRERIGRIVVAWDREGREVTTSDLQVAGAMTAWMTDAVHPNLLQTIEGQPMLVHAGPFANIALGQSSVIADRMGTLLTDYLVTESGFGSDIGFEKFWNLKCRYSGLRPDAVVIVATIRALKSHGGGPRVRPGQPLGAGLHRREPGAGGTRVHQSAGSYRHRPEERHPTGGLRQSVRDRFRRGDRLGEAERRRGRGPLRHVRPLAQGRRGSGGVGRGGRGGLRAEVGVPVSLRPGEHLERTDRVHRHPGLRSRECELFAGGPAQAGAAGERPSKPLAGALHGQDQSEHLPRSAVERPAARLGSPDSRHPALPGRRTGGPGGRRNPPVARNRFPARLSRDRRRYGDRPGPGTVLTGMPVSDRFSLEGKVAVVTGAGSGLGEDLALALAEAGADLVIGDLDGTLAEAAARRIRRRGRDGLGVEADVSRPSQVDRMMGATEDHFGRLDILVNNAGISIHAVTLDAPLDVWQRVFDVNSTGTFLCSQRAGRIMVPQGGGCIINIASVYGHVGVDPSVSHPPGTPTREDLAYSASKGAVISMTRALATYWAEYKIRVNAISPGMIRTERLKTAVPRDTWSRMIQRTPLKRPGTGQDLQGAVIYLASDAASFVTGQVLCVDGGWLAW